MAEKNVKFYKTKDGTIVVCKDEFARQQIEQLQGIWEAIEELPDGQAVSAQVAIHTTEIAALQSGKANINGSYEGMTVGMSKNIEAREIVSGIFTHRPTAGNAECATGAAKVRSIKGNSVAWGQVYKNVWFPTSIESGITYTVVDSYTWNISGTATAQNTKSIYYAGSVNIGHKYYISIGQKIEGLRFGNAANVSDFGVKSWVFVAVYGNIQLRHSADAVITNKTIKPILLDLTAIGIDNLTTAAEVEAWLQANVGLQPYYAYNAGKLLATKLLGLRTVWLNQWDEQWEEGGLTQDIPLNRIRSKNYIPVIPSSTLYITTNANVAQYNADKELIGYGSNGSSSVPTYQSGEFVINSQAKYIKFNTGGTYGNTYNHDICINLHYTNGRDGQYEPYVEHQYNFDTSKVYGKLNGDGNYVQVFPDGMKSAGSVRDELTIKDGAAKVVKRVGSVDLGTLTWYYDSTNARFHAVVAGYSATSNNLLCAKYPTTTNSSLDKTIIAGLYYGVSEVIIKDSAYTDAVTFLSAMNGVMLYYELADAVEYTDLVYRDNGVDVPLLDYFSGVILVDNFGTEEQLLESPTNNNPNSCAAGMDIVYGVNAADFIDAANNGSFISKPSQDALLSTLSAVLGGTLSDTWNETTGHYDYTFTQNRQSNEEPHDD